MRVILEAEVLQRVTPALAFAAARDALVAAVREGVSYPIALLAIGDDGRRMSVKAAALDGAPGVKLGSLWPANPRRGLPSHSSLILLADPETGRIDTIVEAGAANAMRTAAADAVATSVLARPDARTLTIFGSGQQAYFEAKALLAVRPIDRILIVARNAGSAGRLAETLRADGVAAEVRDPETACRAADIIVTATPARAPLFEAAWITPGAHVSAMGADGRGKQELPVELLRRADLFCDLPAQSVEVGEFQSVASEIAAGRLTLTAIGEVLTGRHPGRSAPDQVTVFDSSGLALQDLCLAQRLAAPEEGRNP